MPAATRPAVRILGLDLSPTQILASALYLWISGSEYSQLEAEINEGNS